MRVHTGKKPSAVRAGDVRDATVSPSKAKTFWVKGIRFG